MVGEEPLSVVVVVMHPVVVVPVVVIPFVVLAERIAGRKGDTEVFHARIHDPDEGTRDIILNVAVIPREAGADHRSKVDGARRRLEKEIGIAKRR